MSHRCCRSRPGACGLGELLRSRSAVRRLPPRSHIPAYPPRNGARRRRTSAHPPPTQSTPRYLRRAALTTERLVVLGAGCRSIASRCVSRRLIAAPALIRAPAIAGLPLSSTTMATTGSQVETVLCQTIMACHLHAQDKDAKDGRRCSAAFCRFQGRAGGGARRGQGLSAGGRRSLEPRPAAAALFCCERSRDNDLDGRWGWRGPCRIAGAGHRAAPGGGAKPAPSACRAGRGQGVSLVRPLPCLAARDRQASRCYRQRARAANRAPQEPGVGPDDPARSGADRPQGPR